MVIDSYYTGRNLIVLHLSSLNVSGYSSLLLSFLFKNFFKRIRNNYKDLVVILELFGNENLLLGPKKGIMEL